MAGRVDFDDESLWPLLLVRYVGTPSPEQQEEYQARLSACLRRGQKYVSIIDTRSFAGIPAAQRQRMAEFLREHEELFRQVTLGTCLLITSPMVRLVVSVVFHLKPMPTPYFIAPSMQAALDWVIGRLEAAGLTAEAARIRQHSERLVLGRTG
ncbi:STAS/SEC14 domain-containing protein [Vitiosangium sp. GDMCC 1.1324]|uniref:STAS/SEC14 domain-containing protein n=1 Tax=Vitiosangium sp. (strain GDMCC 1.1324) TaxID=2138576 RepID=UPI000D36C471|nr:STAS/SEC14 domain-containing protein [Vitiosangium sp. GDMCC 1.1324]PTL75974.1 hypothetical protein DAT35_51515 [Vitiosangium sp. GDMCC 1.1324]